MVESIFSKLLLPAEKFSSATGGKEEFFPSFLSTRFLRLFFFSIFYYFPAGACACAILAISA
jgi:hypothetical protein